MAFTSCDLRRYGYFSRLSDGALEALTAKLRAVELPAGTEIVKEGALGDSFYFVKQGRVEVTKKTEDGQAAKLNVVASGHDFGEMALLTCSVRTASVRAITAVTLYRLPKKDFEDVVLHEWALEDALEKKMQDYSQYNKIKMLQPFALLDVDKMYVLMSRMHEKKYAPGEDIVAQGQRGDSYYVVKSGRVAVIARRKGETEAKEVAVLESGAGFGEEALIREEPRSATCRALTDTTVLVLDKTDFSEILKTAFLDYVYPDDVNLDTYLQDYSLIDARIPPEHDEEHIFGSVNIPLEILREKCREFDPKRQYLTYCTNDSRGMVAAFLLRSRGFNARCLRGGVSAWMGPLESSGQGVYMPQV